MKNLMLQAFFMTYTITNRINFGNAFKYSLYNISYLCLCLATENRNCKWCNMTGHQCTLCSCNQFWELCFVWLLFLLEIVIANNEFAVATNFGNWVLLQVLSTSICPFGNALNSLWSQGHLLSLKENFFKIVLKFQLTL